MNAEQTYRPAGRIVIRRIGEDQLLVPISGMAAGGNVIFPVNETGLFVWERICSGETLNQVAQGLSDLFSVRSEQSLLDCEEIVQQFLDHKLLETLSL